MAAPQREPTSDESPTKSGAAQTRLEAVLEAVPEAVPEVLVLDVESVSDDHLGATSNLMISSTHQFRKNVRKRHYPLLKIAAGLYYVTRPGEGNCVRGTETFIIEAV